MDFSPVQRYLNEPELRKDIEGVVWRMRIKLNFQNETSEYFSDEPAFCPKSNWKIRPGPPSLELFLSQIEKDIFENLVKDSKSINSNMNKEEWDASRGLADDRNIVIKNADKVSCVVVWCRDDCSKEAENQLKDNSVYKDVILKKQCFQSY